MPLHAEAERSIDVPAPTVYRLIADFENHHLTSFDVSEPSSRHHT